jgi:hypothetical protein
VEAEIMANVDENRIESLSLFLTVAFETETGTGMTVDEMREMSELDEVAKMVLEISDQPPVFLTTT